ncbi:unnamed protein product [Rhizoctonia solani]|uniref:O-methylsterigmatocystin oxidoreductase n=1 Tax=Rhizoctonia solani TaxID=456999 RepID=A0A8H3HRL8_9AGAM|nr:unnamed protein product [Rhizoctonia solani]
MPVNTIDLAGGGAGIVLLYLLFFKRRSKTSNLPLPPGPTCWPIVGCLFSVPKDEASWKCESSESELVYIRVLGQETVVLNTHQAAKDLLEGRSNLYSDRPHMTMASELIGWEDFLGMCKYGERARGMRRLLHTTMNPRAVQDWWPQQEQEAHKFLRRLLHTPEDLNAHLRHTAGATATKLTYGYTVQDGSDEYIARAERALSAFAYASTPGRFLVDFFPFLKYIPWAPFKRKAAEWRAQLVDFAEAPMSFVHTQLANGTAEPSFVSSWFQDAEEEDKHLIPCAAGSIYAGAADTTVSAISTFFIAMLHYPEIQRTAQAEIDRVIGSDRLPSFTDQESLPYAEAIFKEVLRWQPLAPIGMRIPGGTNIIANAWNMLRDPDAYKDPEQFNPARFLGSGPESSPEEIIFGFGRRRCPGAPVAHSSVWLSIVLTLATYDISPIIGDNGSPLLPSLDYTVGVISHPLPFRCYIKPRSNKAQVLIENTIG